MKKIAFAVVVFGLLSGCEGMVLGDGRLGSYDISPVTEAILKYCVADVAVDADGSLTLNTSEGFSRTGERPNASLSLGCQMAIDANPEIDGYINR